RPRPAGGSAFCSSSSTRRVCGRRRAAPSRPSSPARSVRCPRRPPPGRSRPPPGSGSFARVTSGPGSAASVRRAERRVTPPESRCRGDTSGRVPATPPAHARGHPHVQTARQRVRLPPPVRPPPARPRPEAAALDDRLAPAITTGLGGGTLTITGDAANDSVRVWYESGTVKVKDFTTGYTYGFAGTAVQRVALNGGAGDDWLNVDCYLPATFDG